MPRVRMKNRIVSRGLTQNVTRSGVKGAPVFGAGLVQKCRQAWAGKGARDMTRKKTCVHLRKAEEADRWSVYQWLANSDLTPSMMGPPHYPDHPVPTWEAFCEDYRPHYFDDSDLARGRCFIITVEGIDLGVVCYNAIDSVNKRTDVDIWLRCEKDCGQGYGPQALVKLCDHLQACFGIGSISVSPSQRNSRAIAAYQKAGFKQVPPEDLVRHIDPRDLEYKDNIVLVKHLTRPRA